MRRTQVTLRRLAGGSTIAVLLVLLAGCGVPGTLTFPLRAADGSGVRGTVEFQRVDDATTDMTVRLEGLDPDASYPLRIVQGTIGNLGAPIIDEDQLTPVDGDDGVVVNRLARSMDTFFSQRAVLEILPEVGLTVVAQGNIGVGF